jgi:hypothetical protein
MLRKIWGIHRGDFEECRLLGHKNLVSTSQEKHQVSATEPSRLMLRKIWGFQGVDYEERRLLGCDTVWILQEPTLRNIVDYIKENDKFLSGQPQHPFIFSPRIRKLPVFIAASVV